MKNGHGMPLHRHTMTMHVVGTSPRTHSTLPIRGVSSIGHSAPIALIIFAILAASASYIAVPAAMRLAAPKADPGLYIPMALGITFPFNITIGMPIYYAIARFTNF